MTRKIKEMIDTLSSFFFSLSLSLIIIIIISIIIIIHKL